jgi:glucose/arabinose dehydrogenase/mono/diheme cytochrome c family protein
VRAASLLAVAAFVAPSSFAQDKAVAPEVLTVNKGDRIVLLGAGMGSRMNHFGHFETELFLRFPVSQISIRNMCDEGNTPGFRPHPGRNHDGQFAFPGAKELVHKKYQINTKPAGHFETADQWLTRLKADTVIAFFGFNSSFEGPADVERFKKEFEAFMVHTQGQKYNGKSAPQLALVSPSALQDLSATYGIPNGAAQNANLALYTEAMRDIAARNRVLFVDTFAPSKAWYQDGKEYTTDGALLNDRGYRKLAPLLAESIFGTGGYDSTKREAVHAAVTEKNWAWLNDYKIPNGVHVYGRRYKPFGPGNYPFELKKTREMTEIRDRAIWSATAGENFDLAAADAVTSGLPPVKSNYRPGGKNGNVAYNKGAVSQTQIKVADGYRIELFADEEQFPDLANPVQMAFDNKGRLWVATMASYPHYRIGDPRPQDKLIIFEDTDNDGKADKQINFAEDLHIPIGFEISHDGVYLSQSGSLIRLKDEDGDDKYDTKEVLLSGFDDHDTHHAISAFCADPSGAFIMCEGVFLHSNVESAYGPQRGTNGGFFRYSPQRKHLIRYSQFSIPNPWGVAFDDYGQDFFLHTSGTSLTWMMPGTVTTRYGFNMRAPDIITGNKVRPTSGIEFVSSRHFPDEVQGDILLNNNIGFLGAKQHQLIEDGTGFTTKFRHDLFVSKDLNFRPTDLEFAPDGSLYVVDWQNALIGHMQHSARDPNRDHQHGRIYRVTYPSRPLVKPAKIAGAPISVLLENLKLHEARSRYRTRRELRGRDAKAVLPAVVAWVAALPDGSDRLKLEALWVTWGADRVDVDLLNDLLASTDHRIRAGAVRVLRFNGHRIRNQRKLLLAAANDEHGRVRLEAITAASSLDKSAGLPIIEAAKAKGLGKYSQQSYDFALGTLNQSTVPPREADPVVAPKHLTGAAAKLYVQGGEIYGREAHCTTCHQVDGKGLPDSGFPPVAGTKWTLGDPDRLIKLTLKGLMGPIEVEGKTYPGQVPMTPFEYLLKDGEIAAVLTYVRNSFGNKAGVISAEQVGKVRRLLKGRAGLYSPEELLKEHPHAK